MIGVAALVTAWLLFGFLAAILECTPIEKAWLPYTPGHCLDSYRYLVAFQIGHVVTDVLITFLPLPLIWGLHTGWSRKMVLTGTFFCGYW